MLILLYVFYASGVPFLNFCCLLSLLNAKWGQLNSYFCSALSYDLMKGSFQIKQECGFFAVQKMKCISIKVQGF